jgi:hypothetical protein
MMKARRLDFLVRKRKEKIEEHWKTASELIDRKPADIQEIKIDFSGIQSELTKLANKQALSENSIDVAAYSCGMFREDCLVPQSRGQVDSRPQFGIDGTSAIDEDRKLLELASFQARAANQVAALLIEQLKTKLKTLETQAQSRRNEIDESRKKLEKSFEHRFHLLEVFVISVYVAELAAEFAHLGPESKTISIGPLHLTWNTVLLFPAAFVAALVVLGWIGSHSSSVSEHTPKAPGLPVPVVIFTLLVIALIAGVMLAIFGH